MENKKIDFCLTPRVDYSNTKKIIKNNSSTPFLRNHKLPILEFKFEESLATNLTGSNLIATNLTGNHLIANNLIGNNLTANNLTANATCYSTRERSLYVQPNINQNERLCREFELLKMKFLNQKYRTVSDESNKKVEAKIRIAFNLLDDKRDLLFKLNRNLKRKNLIIELKEKVDYIFKYANDLLPTESLNELEDRLKSYKLILMQSLETFEIMNLKNGNLINELFELVNKQEFGRLMEMNRELSEKKMVIKLERSKRTKSIEKIKLLYKEFQNLFDLIECLSKKNAL